MKNKLSVLTAVIIFGFSGCIVFVYLKNAIIIGHTFWSLPNSFWFTIFVCVFAASAGHIYRQIKGIFKDED